MTEKRYVDVNALIAEYDRVHIGAPGGARKLMVEAPTADVVEVKHGYFVRNERNFPKMKEFHEKGCALSMSEKSIFYTCSECGVWISLSQKYCSMCGAKMDGTPTEGGGQFVD